MNNEKGGLIKKKNKPIIMKPSVPVVKKNDMDFGYTAPENKNVPLSVPQKDIPKKRKTSPSTKPKKMGVGKSNSTKSLKVPTSIHSELNLLGSFMNEHKIYVILQTLIDSYVGNELTDRQKRQFEFMIEAFFEEK